MVLEPMNPTVMQTYRDTLQVGSAPSFIDSSEKIIPVAVVAGAIDVTTSSTIPIFASTQSPVSIGSGKAGVSITSGTGILVRTNTAGKSFYVTAFYLGVVGATNPTFDIRNGTTIAGTVVWSGGSLLGASDIGPIVVSLPTPIKFSTGIFLDTGNGGPHTIVYAFSGYEA